MKRIVVFTIFLFLLFSPSLPLKAQNPGDSSRVSFQMLEKVLDLFAKESNDSLDLQDCFYKILKDGISACDDYAAIFIGEKEIEAFDKSLSDVTFSGVGMAIFKDEGQIIVVPLVGSPAELAGLKPGDILIKVDSLVIHPKISIDKPVQLIRGPKETIVKITVMRDGKKIGPLAIVRKEITVPSVLSEMADSTIGYIRIARFYQNLHDSFPAVAETLIARGAESFIIDLRNNPGGFLHPTLSVLANFFSPDSNSIILTIKQRGKIANQFTTTVKGSLNKMPVVVLQNRYSASSSEIFSGVLKDWGVAKIVGDTTFGKGSVQTVFLKDAKGNDPKFKVKITTAEYFVGNGMVRVNHAGIAPDYLIPDSLGHSDKRLTPLNKALIDPENDPQLKKAIELLRED